jgi:HNH endonuclease
LAHRVAWELAVGPIPFGFQINHGPCDNPSCVSPDHLYLGFAEVNVRDCASKGRIARKLLPGHVVEARELYRLDGWSIPALAERFSCNPVTMTAVITEESWVHLTSAMVSIQVQAATIGVASQAIATQFGVSWYTVRRIVTGRTWQSLAEVA